MAGEQKFYIGRVWFFFWAHVDADGAAVDEFATNTYYVALVKKSTIATDQTPIVRLECEKTLATGELYAEYAAANTASLAPGAYQIFYEAYDSEGRQIGLADRTISVERAPDWEVA
jgi:hypothetical protein